MAAQSCNFNANLGVFNNPTTIGVAEFNADSLPYDTVYRPYASDGFADIIDIAGAVEVTVCVSNFDLPASEADFDIIIAGETFNSENVLTQINGLFTCGILSVSVGSIEAELRANDTLSIAYDNFGSGWTSDFPFFALVNRVEFDYDLIDDTPENQNICQGQGIFSLTPDDRERVIYESFEIIPPVAGAINGNGELNVDLLDAGATYFINRTVAFEPSFILPFSITNVTNNEVCEMSFVRGYRILPAPNATIEDAALNCAATGYDLRNIFTETTTEEGTFTLVAPPDGATLNGAFLNYSGVGCVDVRYTVAGDCETISDDAMVFFPEAVSPSFQDTSSLNCWTGVDPLPVGVVVTSPEYSVTPDYLWFVPEDGATGVTVNIDGETTVDPTITLTDGQMNSYGEVRLCYTESITTDACDNEEECVRTFCRNLTITIFDCNEECNAFQEPGGELCPVATNDFFQFSIFGFTVTFGNPDTALVASTVVAGEFIDPTNPNEGGTLPPFISCTDEEVQVSWDFGLNEDALPAEEDPFFDEPLQEQIPGVQPICDLTMFGIPIPMGTCFIDNCPPDDDMNDICILGNCIQVDRVMPFEFLNFVIPGTNPDPDVSDNMGVRLCDATPRQLIIDPLRAIIDATATSVTWADTDGDGAFDTELLLEGLEPDGSQPSQGTAFVPNNVQGEGTIRVRNLASSIFSTDSPCESPPALNLLEYLPIDAIPIAGPIISAVLSAGGADVNIVPSALDDLPIRVINDQNPEFLNFPEQYVFSTSGDCSTTANWSTPIAIDGCTRIVIEEVVQTAGPLPGSELAIPNPDSVGTDNPNVYEVAYTATACNDQDTTMTFRILLSDGAPVIQCPQDLTIFNDVDQCSRVVTGISPLGGAGCNASISWTAPGATPASGDDDASGTTFPLGTTEVTYTLSFTDENGVEQMSSCSFDVTVEDGQKPEVACTDFEIRLGETGMAVVTTSDIDGGSTDNCTASGMLNISLAGPGSTTFGDSVTFDCFEEGQNTVILSVIDEAMNESRCLARVTVTDFFEEYTVTLDVPELCLEQPSAEQLDFSNYLTIADPQGNVTTQADENNDGDLIVGLFGISSFVSSVPDVVATIGTSPDEPGVTGYIDPITGEYTPGSGTGFVTISYVLSIAGQVSPGFSGLEGCFVLTNDVFELRQPLTMDSPECACIVQNDRIVDLSEISGGLEPYTIQYGGVKLDFDNDGISDDENGEFTFSGMLQGSANQPFIVDSSDFVQDLGQLLVDYTQPTWFFTVVDARGCELFRSGSCDNVDLDGPPEILCEDLGPVSLFTEEDLCEAQYTWAHPLPTDNCDVIIYTYTITNPDGSLAGPFDLAALLNPNVPPVVDAQGTYEFQHISPVLVESVVTYYAEDAVGNFTTCSFTVSVEDETEPFFLNCPEPAVVVNAIEGQCEAFANYSLPLAADNCNLASVIQVDTTGLISGDLYPVGITINTFEATDLSGNMLRCDVKVIVNDIFLPPTFDCPGDVVTTTDDGDCGAIVDDIAPGNVMDNCIDNVTTIYQITDPNGNVVASGFDDASGFFFDLGVSTVSYATQDMPLLLITEVTHDIGDPVDGTDPIPTYAAAIPASEDFLEITNFNSAVLDVSCLTVLRYSALGIDTFAVPTFTLLEPGGTLVIHFGDGTDAPADDFFNDPGAPDLAPEDGAAYVLTLAGEVLDVLAVNDYDLTGLDAATGFTGTISSGSGAGIIRTTVFDTDSAADFVAGEACNPTTIGTLNPQLAQPTPNGGQTAIQAQPIVRVACTPFTVTVTDDEAPVCGLYSDYLEFTTGPITVDFGECVQSTIITVPDDILIADLNFSIEGNAGDLGNLTISLISPEGAQVDFIEAMCVGTDEVDFVFDGDAPGSVADNCGNLNDGGLYVPAGDIESFNGQNAQGDWILQISHNGSVNMLSANFNTATLLVSDRQAYTQQDTILENDPGVCGADFSFLEAILFDNCPGGNVVRDLVFEDGSLLESDTIGILTLNTEFTFFFPVGTTTVRFTLIDAAGNPTVCSFDVTVLDTEDPLLVCPADVTIQLISGACEIVYVPTDFEATDNCAVTEIFSVPDFNLPLPIGVNEVTFTIQDAAGNDTTCVYTVTVLENIPNPVVMSCITNISVHLGPTCEQEIIPEMVLTGNDFFCFDNYVITILVNNPDGSQDTLTDNFVGIEQVDQEVIYSIFEPNTGQSCWGFIEVGFFEPPVVICPADTVLACNTNIGTAELGIPEILSCAAAGAEVSFADTTAYFGLCDATRATISRTWRVTDAFGNTASCVQVIDIESFDLGQVMFPINLDDIAAPALSCAAVAIDPLLTDPVNTGFPFVPGGGNIFESGFCSTSFGYTDVELNTCGAGYEILRTWLVRNTCQPIEAGVNPLEFTQIIAVVDGAPVVACPDSVSISTGPFGCDGAYVVPAPEVIAGCSDFTYTVTASSGTLTLLSQGYYILSDLDIGTHSVTYDVENTCEQHSFCTYFITVTDQMSATAICEDGLNVSLNSNGNAEILAADIDGGSSDLCGTVDLSIRRTYEFDALTCTQLGSPFDTDYGPSVDVNCCDLDSLVKVQLRVVDPDGNVSTCWTSVLVEDKLAPICVPPAPITVTCADLAQNLPEDLNVLFANDPLAGGILLDDVFGQANGIDNCPAGITTTQSVSDTRNSCGVGTIQRFFTFVDNNNALLLSSSCSQNIEVIGAHDYTIVFPGDAESDDCIEPDYNAVSFTEIGCDLITIATDIDTFSATADECYKLRITYEVLNWCEYNATDAAYQIPRDADGDGIFDQDTTVLHVVPRAFGIEDDLAILDRDVDRDNFNMISNLDTGDGGILPGVNVGGYGIDGSRGAFNYEQYIKVYDDSPPVLTVTEPDTAFCSFDNVDCDGDVALNFELDDECSPESVSIIVSLDAFIDAGPDGIFTLAEFVADGGDVSSQVSDDGTGQYTINLDNLPIGRHAVRIAATDGCGNNTVDLIVFEVVDCKAPTPICINGLTATLMPTGNPGEGMASIWATDFIASGVDDCSGPVKFAIYLDGEQPQIPSPADTGLVLDCDQLGPISVRVYAIDASGNFDYCLTSLLVQGFSSNICNPNAGGSLSGMTITPANEAMNGVNVGITSPQGMTNSTQTQNGVYQFSDLTEGDDYTVEPTYNAAISLSRVTTADIITISRHILGLEEFEFTYQPLAADVNQDGTVNIIDIIGIRRVILGLDNGFQFTNSWRFYLDDGQGSAETFTENNLIGNVNAPNFIAVEMGNLNGTPLSLTDNGEGRSGRMGLHTEDIDLETGRIYAINISSPQELDGFQGTLQLGDGLELLEVDFGLMEAGNFNLSRVPQGVLAMSYDGTSGKLFTLKVRAMVNGRLSEQLTINDAITFAEGYSLNGKPSALGIDFTDEALITGKFELYQNSPNPFGDKTEISFKVPVSGMATLIVQNIAGQLILEREMETVAGINRVAISVKDLNGASGVLTYTVISGESKASRKMIRE